MTAIYCRQSVDKRDSISIETQIELCRRQLADGESAEIYTDRGYSGSSTRRPGFARMMSDVENGSIDQVIVYRLDRISRSLLDFAGISDTFGKHGITFISATEKFDTSTPMGNAMLNIVMVFAQLERETIRTRIKDNYYERGRNGLYLGGRAPFGFARAESMIHGVKSCVLAEVPGESAAVRYIFERYREDGASLGMIARELNSPQCAYRTYRRFTAAFLARLLRNPVYVRADGEVYDYLSSKGAVIHNERADFDGVRGCTVYGERKNKTRGKFTDLFGENIRLDRHEGLIGAREWLSVQEKLSRNAALRNTGRGKNSWLGGLVKCGCCGMSVCVVNGQKNGRRYMNCGGRKAGICAGKPSGTFDELEAAVEKRLLERIAGFPFTRRAPVSHNREAAELKARINALQNEINVITERLSRVNETAVKYLSERLEALDAQKNALMLRLSAAEQKSPPEKLNISLSYEEWLGLPFEGKKEIAGLFISRVVIAEDITVEYTV